jgi:hypothetical protein
MAQALFVTRDDIVKFTALNGNIDTDKFVQFVKIAQDTHIQTYLGTQLFNKLNDDIVNDDLSEPYTTLLTKNEVDFLIEKARDIAQHYTNRFIDYMSFNQVSFPEYNANSNGDMYPDKDAYFTGWVL